jgi:TRAP-type C4-dicarboxylate transport system permease small subunit
MTVDQERRIPGVTATIDVVHRVIELLCVLLLLVMIIVTVYQVFMRSVLNSATSWSEEIALLMMIWFGYMGMALGVRERVHISVDFLFERLPRIVQILMDAIGRILVSVFAFTMLQQGMFLTSISTIQRFPATRIPRAWMYIVLVISGFLMLLYVVESILQTLLRLQRIRREAQNG